jgi:hypothetical protein
MPELNMDGKECEERRMTGRLAGIGGTGARTERASQREVVVVILGIVLLIIGLIASLSILVWLGVLLVVVGLVLNLVPIGGTRRRYY